MKILLIGDKESTYLWDHFDYARFSDIDCIISTGDLKAEYLRFLVTVTNVPLFFVHGNHDDHYETNRPEGCDSIDGKLIEFKGKRILGIGGSMLYNGGSHQFSEFQMKTRILKLTPRIMLNHGFDILVSHSPARGLGDGTDLCHTGFQGLRDLVEKYHPAYHLHGHQHLSYNNDPRIIRHGSTTIINCYEYHLLTID